MIRTILLIILITIPPAHARDDGRYANSPLKSWFNGLASGKGLCCSFADGVKIEDVDWDFDLRFSGKGFHSRLQFSRSHQGRMDYRPR